MRAMRLALLMLGLLLGGCESEDPVAPLEQVQKGLEAEQHRLGGIDRETIAAVQKANPKLNLRHLALSMDEVAERQKRSMMPWAQDHQITVITDPEHPYRAVIYSRTSNSINEDVFLACRIAYFGESGFQQPPIITDDHDRSTPSLMSRCVKQTDQVVRHQLLQLHSGLASRFASNHPPSKAQLKAAVKEIRQQVEDPADIGVDQEPPRSARPDRQVRWRLEGRSESGNRFELIFFEDGSLWRLCEDAGSGGCPRQPKVSVEAW